jgi:hypothetical protein
MTKTVGADVPGTEMLTPSSSISGVDYSLEYLVGSVAKLEENETNGGARYASWKLSCYFPRYL